MVLSKPALKRLVTIYRILGDLVAEDCKTVSSRELGLMMGTGAHNIRKDLTLLGELGNSGKGYDVLFLRSRIAEALFLNRKRKACVVGLGRLGSAILDYENFSKHGYTIVAGFDSDINRLDTIKTAVKVYPSYEIQEIIERESIELAAITVPAENAESVFERLINGGIKGVVNFSSAHLISPDDSVFVRNIDVLSEFTVLSAYISSFGNA